MDATLTVAGRVDGSVRPSLAKSVEGKLSHVSKAQIMVGRNRMGD